MKTLNLEKVHANIKSDIEKIEKYLNKELVGKKVAINELESELYLIDDLADDLDLNYYYTYTCVYNLDENFDFEKELLEGYGCSADGGAISLISLGNDFEDELIENEYQSNVVYIGIKNFEEIQKEYYEFIKNEDNDVEDFYKKEVEINSIGVSFIYDYEKYEKAENDLNDFKELKGNDLNLYDLTNKIKDIVIKQAIKIKDKKNDYDEDEEMLYLGRTYNVPEVKIQCSIESEDVENIEYNIEVDKMDCGKIIVNLAKSYDRIANNMYRKLEIKEIDAYNYCYTKYVINY